MQPLTDAAHCLSIKCCSHAMTPDMLCLPAPQEGIHGKVSMQPWPDRERAQLRTSNIGLSFCTDTMDQAVHRSKARGGRARVGLAVGRLIEAVLAHSHQLVGRQALQVGRHLCDPALDLRCTVRVLIAWLIHQIPRYEQMNLQCQFLARVQAHSTHPQSTSNNRHIFSLITCTCTPGTRSKPCILLLHAGCSSTELGSEQGCGRAGIMKYNRSPDIWWQDVSISRRSRSRASRVQARRKPHHGHPGFWHVREPRS